MAPVWWKVQLPSTNISRLKVRKQNAPSRNENTVHTFTDLSNLVNHAKQWQGKNQVITGVYIIQNYNIDEITYITRKKTLKILCIRKVFFRKSRHVHKVFNGILTFYVEKSTFIEIKTSYFVFLNYTNSLTCPELLQLRIKVDKFCIISQVYHVRI